MSEPKMTKSEVFEKAAEPNHILALSQDNTKEPSVFQRNENVERRVRKGNRTIGGLR